MFSTTSLGHVEMDVSIGSRRGKLLLQHVHAEVDQAFPKVVWPREEDIHRIFVQRDVPILISRTDALLPAQGVYGILTSGQAQERKREHSE